jgi:hypothetical protein
VRLLLNSVHGDVCNSLVAVEDTRDLLEGGALSLGIDEVDPDEFDGDPALKDLLATARGFVVACQGRLTV